MTRANWYKVFFDKYYLPYVAIRKTNSDTRREVLFIVKNLKLKKGAKILDLACGLCRHGFKLAKMGFNITGIDLNSESLRIARETANKDKLRMKLIKGDMRKIPFKNEFDAVINVFTSFGYFENNRDNFNVLREVNKSLKLKGLFLLDLQNKRWVLKNFTKRTWNKLGNIYILEDRSFNKKNDILSNKIVFIKLKNKKVEETYTHNHLYDIYQIKINLKRRGFQILKVFGNYDYSRYHKINSPRMIILARKIKQV